MNILVLNGSPKGDNSVTMASIKYLSVTFPEHDYTVKHVAISIRILEKDQKVFDELINQVRQSDVILWAFPLYFLLVHSNYKRFIELIFEKGRQDAFTGKYTGSFSTSIHFYDHTAHNYIQGICEDLGMHFVSSFSAEMNNLMDEREQQNLRFFMDELVEAYENKAITPKMFPILEQPKLNYQPVSPPCKIDSENLKLVVLTDSGSMSENLQNMLKYFKSSFSKEPEIVDLAEIKITGGCLGCLKCGMDNECVYAGTDDVISTYEEKLKKADIIVFALTMKDRYFSSTWKRFLDRRFYRTHQPGYPGKQIGYLISGPLSFEQNLRQIILASAEIDQANLVGIITDEQATSVELNLSIDNFSRRLIRYSKNNAKHPKTFLGIGGEKIFRDEMWGRLRFIFQADYKYYKRHGMMDFPQSNFGTRLMHLFIPLTKLSPVKEKIQNNIKNMMHRSHDLVIKKEKEKRI
jgi:multimeric flavodoxin WrbA